jgi:chromosome segregation ATPase
MIRKIIFGLPLIAFFFMSCENKEKIRLQAQVDSLRTELQVSQQTNKELEEVGVLIDSIDASRQLLRADVVEGTSYKDYKNRLVSINNHIKETQNKIAELEKTVKKNNASLSTIRRLRSDLEARSAQIAALTAEVEKFRGENASLSRNLTQRDSLLTVNAETIKLREQDVANLETKVEETNTASKNTQADLYFAQAQALETAASRTKFAPRKKKETQREALELYKLSLSLGKQEAQQKIDELEKEVS